MSRSHVVGRGEVGALLGWEDTTKKVAYRPKAPGAVLRAGGRIGQVGRSRTKMTLGKDSMRLEGAERKPVKINTEQESNMNKEGEHTPDQVRPALKDVVRSLDLISSMNSSHVRVLNKKIP